MSHVVQAYIAEADGANDTLEAGRESVGIKRSSGFASNY